MAIPLENVYYLLCYAWNRLDARDRVDVSAVPGNRIENLLAKVLIEGTAHLLRSGLDRSYVFHQIWRAIHRSDSSWRLQVQRQLRQRLIPVALPGEQEDLRALQGTLGQ